MASNTRLTAEGFLQNISKYATGTAARRAIGRSYLSASEKNKCLAAIASKFGEASTPVATTGKKRGKKAAKKVAKKAKASKKVAAKAPAKRIAKKTSKKVAKKAAGKAAATKSSGPDVESETITSLSKINLLGQVVGTASEAIRALEWGKRLNNQVDISAGVSHAGRALEGAMAQLSQIAQSELSGMDEQQLLNHPTTIHSPPEALESFGKVDPTNPIGPGPNGQWSPSGGQSADLPTPPPPVPANT